MKYAHFLAVFAAMSQLSTIAIASEAKTPAIDLSVGNTLYTVGYSHLDTQWRWNYVDTISRFIPNTLHDNFNLIEKYPDYIFNFSGANRYRMIKEYYPADYEKVKHYISTGRWFPCGSSMEECDLMTTSAESIIRQVLYGNHYFKQEFGKASNEFMNPDCFGFPASLPELLSHCGITGFSTQKLTWGSAVGIPFNIGLWESFDGSSVIAALNPGWYQTRIDKNLSNDKGWLKRIDENGKSGGVFADYQYYGVGDIGGAPQENSVKWIEKSVNSDGPVKVISSKANQMFLDIDGNTNKLPRYKGDILLVEHSAGSITSQAYMKQCNRMNEILADSAEKASVAANWLGGLAYQQKKLNNAWTLVMGGQFHDILPGTSQPKAYEYSWNDDILAMNQFSNIFQQAIKSISSGLDTSAKGRAVVVYNPLSIDREDIVETTIKSCGSTSVVDVIGPDGKVTPSQIIARDGDSLKVIFIAKVPSVGLAVYDVCPAKVSIVAATNDLSVTRHSLENSRYQVTLDTNGDISRIYDKFTSREMLASPIRLAFSTDIPREWPAWNIDWKDQCTAPRNYVCGPVKVKVVENGPVRVALEVKRETEGSVFVQTIRLSSGSAGNHVEISNSIDWRSKECNLKAVFPLTVSNPLATYNWEVGTITRGNNIPKEYEVPSHQWFDLTDIKGDYGVSVLSPFKYGSDKPSDSVLRLTLLRTPGVTDCYYDQATQDWGHHEIRYALVGHKNDWRSSQTDWQALRFEQPLIAFESASHMGKLGKSMSFVRVNNPNVRIMTVKKAEDSNEIVVRVVETCGTPANDTQITFAGKIASAREVNGQEQPVRDATVVDGKLAIDLKAYGIRSFAIKLIQPGYKTQKPICKSISIPYDKCVTSHDGEKTSSGFDTDGNCLAAEMLPDRISDGAVSFKLKHISDGKPNSVTCKGQTIVLPKGNFNKIAILAAGSNGDQPALFDIDGRKTSLTIQDWGGYIGQWDSRVWKGALSDNDPAPDIEKIVPGYIKQAPVAWFSSHKHNADGKNEPYSYSYLYTFYIDSPSGAKSLALPNNTNIHILAMSAFKE